MVLGVALAGCGDLVRQGTSPVQVVVDELRAAPGDRPDELRGTLLSDVVTKGSVYDDVGEVTFSLVLKDQGDGGVADAPSPLNQVTLNRYHVTYRRADGHNVPGHDVPFAFDSAFTSTVGAQGAVTADFELVRHVAKLEAPLQELGNGDTLINTIAEVTFYGVDQAGNDVSVTGQIGIVFGNFADPEN